VIAVDCDSKNLYGVMIGSESKSRTAPWSGDDLGHCDWGWLSANNAESGSLEAKNIGVGSDTDVF
jgi:hypothetical protein